MTIWFRQHRAVLGIHSLRVCLCKHEQLDIAIDEGEVTFFFNELLDLQLTMVSSPFGDDRLCLDLGLQDQDTSLPCH
jgi:hypothetical protein